MNWHYAENGQQIGPVTDAQLAQLVQSGRITADTLVWHEGMADWSPYRDVAAQLNQPASMPPPISSPAASTTISEVICAECGKPFPAADTIQIGKARVCAACKPVFLQKLSEGASINTGEMNYAGFGIRFAAKILDFLIVGLIPGIVLMALLIPAIAHANENSPPQLGFIQLFEFAIMLVNMAYQIFFLGKYGATPGKMICKIKVVTSEGEKISYGRATGRFFAEMLSGMICYIGYLMVAFDQEERRALHDHICNTRVIYK
jgi:uncharacterized RDD family membrane protein YckC